MYIDKAYIEKTFKVAPKASSVSCEPEEAQAFKKIERLISVRDRSVSEIHSRLKREDFSEEAINCAIDRALRCGYLDDARFADALIRGRLRAGKGMSGIVRELRSHHIEAEDLPDFPERYQTGFPDELDAATQLLLRKPPRAKNRRNAAYAKLIRNGYSSSVALQAVKNWSRIAE